MTTLHLRGWLLLLALPNLAVLERVWNVLLRAPTAQALGDAAVEPARLALLVSYAVAVVLIVPSALQWLSSSFSARPRGARVVMLMLVAVAVAITAWIYPEVDSGRFGFYSDRDEALDVGSRALLAGDNPYRCRVLSGEHHACGEVGNPIGPLPGALLLAAPFVLAFGASAFQTPFWIALWLLVAIRAAGATGPAAAWALIAALLLPIAIAELATGGDLLANALWVSVGVWLLARRGRLDALGWALAALLGLMLAGRSNFLLVLPVLGLWLARCWGWRDASLALGSTCTVFVGISLPFLLLDPQEFGPLLVQQKLQAAGGSTGQVLALVISAAVAVGAGLLARTRHTALLACAVSLTVPALAAVILHSWSVGRLDFGFFGWYALSATPIALLGLLELQRGLWVGGGGIDEDTARPRSAS